MTGALLRLRQMQFASSPVTAENVRSFPTFTQDLYRLPDWLTECWIQTVAME